jgi:hypothetical protein
MITLGPVKMGEFQSGEMEVEELKRIITEVVNDTYPDDEIKTIKINNEGMIDVVLSSGEEIEIEIDWNEIILT